MRELWGHSKAGKLERCLTQLVDSVCASERKHKETGQAIVRMISEYGNLDNLTYLFTFSHAFIARAEVPELDKEETRMGEKRLRREWLSIEIGRRFLEQYHTLHPERTSFDGMLAGFNKKLRKKFGKTTVVLFRVAHATVEEHYPAYKRIRTHSQTPQWWRVDQSPTTVTKDCWCIGRTKKTDWRQQCRTGCILQFLACFTFKHDEIATALGTPAIQSGLRVCSKYWMSPCANGEEKDEGDLGPGVRDSELTLAQRAMRNGRRLAEQSVRGGTNIESSASIDPMRESFVNSLWTHLLAPNPDESHSRVTSWRDFPIRTRRILATSPVAAAVAILLAISSMTTTVSFNSISSDTRGAAMPQTLRIHLSERTVVISGDSGKFTGVLVPTPQINPSLSLFTTELTDEDKTAKFFGELVLTNAPGVSSVESMKQVQGILLRGRLEIPGIETNTIFQSYVR